METVNVFSAENHDGRLDVGRAVGLSSTLMFVYDLAPGRASSLYHYEFEGEWLLVVEGTALLRAPPTGSTRSSAATSSASRPGRPERTG